MTMYPTQGEIRRAIARSQNWERCEQWVEGKIRNLQTMGARFYRYCNYGVYVYTNHTLYNLESKTDARCLLCDVLAVRQLPDAKRTYAILYQRVDRLAVEIPRGLGKANGIDEPKAGSAYRSGKTDRCVQAIIESGII